MPISPNDGSVIKDYFDAEIVNHLLGLSRVQQMTSEEAEKRRGISRLDALFSDVFASLFRAVPRLRPEDECLGAAYVHRTIMEHTMQVKEFHDLRKHTVLRKQTAAIGAVSFFETLKLPEEVERAAKRVKEAEQQLQKNLDDPKSAREAIKQLRAAQSELQRTVRQTAAKLTAAIVDASKKASKDAEVAENIPLLGWGDHQGNRQEQDPLSAMEAFERLRNDQTLREILLLAGKLKYVALRAAQTRKRRPPGYVVDLELGDNLRLLVPAEIAKLGDALRELDFLARLAQKQLLQYKLEGIENDGNGPIVICIDESASMQGPKNVWAKAIALAIAKACEEEKRDFVVIHFGSTTEIKVSRYYAGKKQSLLPIAKHFFGGGTNFDRPIEEALKEVGKDRRADIVFITDGHCSVTKETTAAVKNAIVSQSLRFIAVEVGEGNVSSLKNVATCALSLEITHEGAVALIRKILE